MLLILLLSAFLAITSLSTLSLSLRDAESVNIAGSLRMQSYRMAFAIYAEPENLNPYISMFEQSLFDPALSRLKGWTTPNDISAQYELIISEWRQVKPTLSKAEVTIDKMLVEHFVNTIDIFVKRIEVFSERKVSLLTIIQAIGFSLILALAWYTVRYTKKEVVKPLLQLVQAVKQIQDGKYSPVLPTSSPNELGILAVGVGNMAVDLGKLYFDLEQKVAQQTQDLSQANKTLAFLHENTQMLQVTTLGHQHISQALDRLRQHLGLAQAKLTLNKKQHVNSEIKSGETNNKEPKNSLLLDLPNLGQLYLNSKHPIDTQAAQSFATMLSKALEHNNAILQHQKLLLVEERASMARELHDSLAQALSYLKIQVTVLKRAVDQQEESLLTATINQLEQGLSNAYLQLRELLSTFRLTVKESNLKEAITLIRDDLQKQTDIDISIDYHLKSFALAANKQIHILQIIREAILNACKHAKCKQIIISCKPLDNDMIQINIADNGTGLADEQAAANHYGILIMSERAEKLNGSLQLVQNQPTGTKVCLTFPQ